MHGRWRMCWRRSKNASLKMSKSVLVGQRIVKDILLHDAGRIAIGREGVAAMPVLLDGFSDPGVDGGEAGAPVGEQGDAVAGFDADPLIFLHRQKIRV